MKYLRVEWRHELVDQPIMYYFELNEHRWEQRRIELFRNGEIGYADQEEKGGATILGDKLPIPDESEIAEDTQFIPEEISRAQFEAMWELRHSRWTQLKI
jgi:hypothetical protein